MNGQDETRRLRPGAISPDGSMTSATLREGQTRVRSGRNGTARKPSGRSRSRLIARLWSSAERQVEEIEARLQRAETGMAGLEQGAKALSVLTRTVRELVAMDAETKELAKAGKGNTDAAATGARSFAEYRAELARTLEKLLAEGEGGQPSGDPSDDDT